MTLLPRGPWCCEEGERLGVTVCPECAETSAAYQSCLGPEPVEPCYVVVMHPDAERGIRTMMARYKWAKAYRLWRQSGRPAATPQQILAGDYTPRLVPAYEYFARHTPVEFGTIEGFRFIASEN